MMMDPEPDRTHAITANDTRGTERHNFVISFLSVSSLSLSLCVRADFQHIRFQTDRMFLAKYLRAFNWDIERSLDVMQKMYRIRVSTRCF